MFTPAIDVERRAVFQFVDFLHTYDLGLEGLPFTNSARDIERKPALAIQGCTHPPGDS
jgi:hypothetical protein